MTTTAAPVASPYVEAPGRFLSRLADVLAQAGAVGFGGGIAGLLAVGIGARLSMRLVALSSGRIGTGVQPESGAVPGQFTAEGTMFLLAAGTVIGATIAVFVGVVLGRWLPPDGSRRTATVLALGALAPALVLIDPNNEDFALFGPAWFAVLLFAACASGYGALLAVVVRRVARPVGGRARAVWIALGAPALAITIMASAGLGGVLIGVPVALALVALLLSPRNGKLRWWWEDGVQRGGEWVLASLTVFAVCWIVVRAGRILLA